MGDDLTIFIDAIETLKSFTKGDFIKFNMDDTIAIFNKYYIEDGNIYISVKKKAVCEGEIVFFDSEYYFDLKKVFNRQYIFSKVDLNEEIAKIEIYKNN